MSLLSRGCECSKERHTFYIVNVDQESESVTDTTKGDIGKERIRNTVPFSLWTRHPCGWWSRRTASRRSAGSARSFQQLLFENGQTKSTVNKIHGFPMRAMLYSLLVDGAAVCSAEFMTMSLKEENMPFESLTEAVFSFRNFRGTCDFLWNFAPKLYWIVFQWAFLCHRNEWTSMGEEVNWTQNERTDDVNRIDFRSSTK